jgi:hypothetical protein
VSEFSETQLLVEHHDDGSVTVYLDGTDSPLRGHGETQILALAALADCLREWANGGSDRWLNSPAGVKFARMFVPDFEPGPQGGSA